ncbi:UNVERIFIED_CONTAM: hypothetical protein Scaly_3066300 [Sesamum calycinum]|uniref:Uncharacterized protein n=1 Tax=Sesamum calycinum TaxID=2727403 RepID=A0AAW2K0N1_9LAMI
MPLTSHLQRLYTSKATTEQLTWHTNHQINEGSMCHPSDAEAYRHFDRKYPDFTAEPRNVRLVRKYETFTMRASLMWIVNDLPAYGIASRWSTIDVMGSPVCGRHTCILSAERTATGTSISGQRKTSSGVGTSHSVQCESNDKSDEDRFDEDYKAEENNYD